MKPSTQFAIRPVLNGTGIDRTGADRLGRQGSVIIRDRIASPESQIRFIGAF